MKRWRKPFPPATRHSDARGRTALPTWGLRSIEAAARRAERDARRQHNELLRQQKHYHRMLLSEQTDLEAHLFENRIELLRSMQKECGPVWDWKGVKASPAPVPPAQKHDREKSAQSALDNFQTTFWDKVFRKVESKRKVLNETPLKMPKQRTLKNIWNLWRAINMSARNGKRSKTSQNECWMVISLLTKRSLRRLRRSVKSATLARVCSFGLTIQA